MVRSSATAKVAHSFNAIPTHRSPLPNPISSFVFFCCCWINAISVYAVRSCSKYVLQILYTAFSAALFLRCSASAISVQLEKDNVSLVYVIAVRQRLLCFTRMTCAAKYVFLVRVFFPVDPNRWLTILWKELYQICLSIEC